MWLPGMSVSFSSVLEMYLVGGYGRKAAVLEADVGKPRRQTGLVALGMVGGAKDWRLLQGGIGREKGG